MDEELLRSNRSGRRPPDDEVPGSSDRPRSTDDPGIEQEAPPFDLPAVHRYLIRLIVDRDEADVLYQRFVPGLQREAQHTIVSQHKRSRLVFRSALIQWLAELQQSDRCPVPLAPLDVSIEEARFDTIWRTVLLERTWQRLKLLEEESGQPFFLAFRQRSEAPGLSTPELADRIALALDRPISTAGTQRLLRRAHAQFSRMLLEEVIATLPKNPPFELLERELIETNLLAFCREAIGGLRRRSSPPGRRPAP